MGNLTILLRDDQLLASLRERANASGRSIEEEAEDMLRDALGPAEAGATAGSLLDACRAFVRETGGVELDIPPRDAAREPPDFSSWGLDE